MRNVGLIAAAAAIAVAANETEPAKKLYVDAAPDGDAFEPLPEITEEPVTTESTALPAAVEETAEPEKPKRGRKKAEVSDESDSDG